MDKWFRRVGCERAAKANVPAELNGRRVYYLPMLGEAEPVESSDDRLIKRVVLTTPIQDRLGAVVVPQGIRMRWFHKNPVVLWSHQYDLPPIGNVDTNTLEVTDKGIEADVVFDQGSVVGREVYGLYDRGVMRAWSVGILPLKWDVIEDEETGKVSGYRVTEWELIELSAVPVPANPEA